MTLADALARLEAVRLYSGGYIAKCPAHTDTTPSLSSRRRKRQAPVELLCGMRVSRDPRRIGRAPTGANTRSAWRAANIR
jgi:hypothetical protein